MVGVRALKDLVNLADKKDERGKVASIVWTSSCCGLG